VQNPKNANDSVLLQRDDEVAVMVTVGTLQHVQIVAPVFLKYIGNRNKHLTSYFKM